MRTLDTNTVALTAEEQEASAHFEELLDNGWGIPDAVRITRLWFLLTGRTLSAEFCQYLSR